MKTSIKRPYLLLELLLAMTLIVGCFFPLLKAHTTLKKRQIEDFENLQLENRALIAFSDLKQQLLSHAFSWKELSQGVEGTLPTPISLLNGLCYETHFRITKKTLSFLPTKKKSYLLANVELFFLSGKKRKGPFSHTIFIECCHFDRRDL